MEFHVCDDVAYFEQVRNSMTLWLRGTTPHQVNLKIELSKFNLVSGSSSLWKGKRSARPYAKLTLSAHALKGLWGSRLQRFRREKCTVQTEFSRSLIFILCYVE